MQKTRTYKLGELIADLEKIPPEMEIYFDFAYFQPSDIDSWRGDYADLAIGYEQTNEKVTVADFLPKLKECVGKVFEGYKGGSYKMHLHTDVWVANYGESANTALVEIIDDGWRIIFCTAYRAY